MNGAQHAVVASGLKTNTVMLRKTRFALHNRSAGCSTPTALCPPAQGCAAVAPKRRYGAPRRRKARATLGVRVVDVSQPQRGCGMVARRADGRNPVGVDCVWRALPKVAPRTAQPWAGGRNPVGILWRGRARNGGAK